VGSKGASDRASLYDDITSKIMAGLEAGRSGAPATRAETENGSDLIPYWIYEGPVKIKRRVRMLPFSREVRRLEWLKRSLTIYRLAFRQSRQEDLVEYLHSLMGNAIAAEDLADLQIWLQPRRRAAQLPSAASAMQRSPTKAITLSSAVLAASASAAKTGS
jgi:hypothetical protein